MARQSRTGWISGGIIQGTIGLSGCGWRGNTSSRHSSVASGSQLRVVTKADNRWLIALELLIWSGCYEKNWDRVWDGEHVSARAGREDQCDGRGQCFGGVCAGWRRAHG